MFRPLAEYEGHENENGTDLQVKRWWKKEIKMADNTQKDPKDWVSGGDPVTGAQESYLKTLAEQAHKPVPKPHNKAEASEFIEKLRDKAGFEK
jgi:hypothetical protein